MITASLIAVASTGIGTAFAATISTSETVTVQSGDTLYKIAEAQGVTLSELEAANSQITNFASITPGQVLNLPGTYVIQPGDTFYKIAEAQGVSLSQLEAVNPQITNYTNLTVGQVIRIPTATSTQSPQPTTPAPTKTSATISKQTSTQSQASTSSTETATQTLATTSAAKLRQNVINYAKTFIGVPYVWGGTSPSGFDCSGFVQYVYLHFGIVLPRESHNQATIGTPVSQANLQPGDLVFFQNTDSLAGQYANHVTHEGIYIGNGAMIEDGTSNGVTIVQNVFSNPYWVSHFYGSRDVIG